MPSLVRSNVLPRNLLARVVFAASTVLPCAALANDTNLTYGGSPRPLNGKGTVSMQSEVVKLDVRDGYVWVDCRFHFVNFGPACKVRVGFPDEDNDIEMDINGKPPPLTSSFRSFRSWVAGKEVHTSLTRNDTTGTVWHVKTVEFKANQPLEVRDLYTVDVGNTVAY